MNEEDVDVLLNGLMAFMMKPERQIQEQYGDEALHNWKALDRNVVAFYHTLSKDDALEFCQYLIIESKLLRARLEEAGKK